jgi:hypothetical protein
VTAWDTLVSGGAVLEELIEAKASPKHSDVVEWLDRVARGNQEHRDRTFQFVYGRETRLLLSLDRLIRIAAESGDDQQKFSRLIEIERKPEFEEALSRLGGEALGILRKMSVRLLPEEFLSEGVSFRSRALAGAGGTAITDHLYTKFSRAMSAGPALISTTCSPRYGTSVLSCRFLPMPVRCRSRRHPQRSSFSTFILRFRFRCWR